MRQHMCLFEAYVISYASSFHFVIQKDVSRDEIGVFRHSSSDEEQHHHTPTNNRQQAEENP